MPGRVRVWFFTLILVAGLLYIPVAVCWPPVVRADTDPEVTTRSATDISDDSAVLRGRIKSDGGDNITKYGFEWGASKSNLNHSKWFYDDIEEGDSFEYEIDGLSADKTYYYWAYAKNSEGDDYGSLEKFTTDEDDDDEYDDAIPLVMTRAASAITNTGATLNGEIEDVGDSDIEEYGFYYGTTTACSTKIKAGSDELDEGDDFNVSITDLVYGTVYYFKAYAENDEGMSYGGIYYFTAGQAVSYDNIPLVATDDDCDVDDDEATLKGRIEAEGGSAITEYGFCYGTTTSCNSSKTVGSDIEAGEDFERTLSSLRDNTTYYYRAYAKNSYGTGYGSLRYFCTDEEDDDDDDEDEPTVKTLAATVGDGWATLNAVLTDEGDSNLEYYGFFWGSENPPQTKVKVGDDDIEEDDNFTYTVSGLRNGTTYYFQAYAQNDDGTAYGDILSFTAGGAGSATGGSAGWGSSGLTTSIGAVAADGVTLNGCITSTGSGTVREYGFIWGRFGGSETKVRLGTTVQPNTNFAYFIPGLENGISYYAKSYAITNTGTSYGPQIGFTTNGAIGYPSVGAPTLLVSSPVPNISVYRAALVSISASASDPIGVQAMGLYVNGEQVSRTPGSSLSYSLDTNDLPPGPCTIRITAWNGTRSSESTVTIYIQEGSVSVSEKPRVSIKTPQDGFQLAVGGDVVIEAGAIGGRGVRAMGLYVDGVQKVRFMGDSFSYLLQSQGMSAGAHDIRVTAWDGAQVGEKNISITVK